MKKSLYIIAMVALTGCGTGKYEQGASVGATWDQSMPENTGEIEVTYHENGNIASVKVKAANANELLLNDTSQTAMKSALSKSGLDKISGNRKGMLDNNAGVSADGLRTEQKLDSVISSLAELNPQTAVLKALPGPKKVVEEEERIINPVIVE